MRNPSTTIKPKNPQGILPPTGDRKETFRSVLAAGREAFPKISGLTCIDAERAFFQSTGDRTFYSVAITREEAASLGYDASLNGGAA